jgi:hypothetical protein
MPAYLDAYLRHAEQYECIITAGQEQCYHHSRIVHIGYKLKASDCVISYCFRIYCGHHACVEGKKERGGTVTFRACRDIGFLAHPVPETVL